jgi:hypothetical protein
LSPINALHEDDDLVELESIKEIDQLSYLLLLLNLEVILFETVKCELSLVINGDLERISHELAAYVLDII